MAEITLPRWIIAQKMMPAGRRQNPKPKLPLPVYAALDKKGGYNPVSHTYPRSSQVYIPKELPKIFEGWEYRFWAMSCHHDKYIIAECRCCGHIGNQDFLIRQRHLSAGGCAKKLTAAFKLLLRDNLCVVCDTRTTREKWGVPMCSPTCQEAWCEVESQPRALAQALSLVGDD